MGVKGNTPDFRGQDTGPPLPRPPHQPGLGAGQSSAIVLTLFTKINKLGLQPYGGWSGVLSGRGLPPQQAGQTQTPSHHPRACAPVGPKFMATLDFSSAAEKQGSGGSALEPLSPPEQAQDSACSSCPAVMALGIPTPTGAIDRR